MSSLESISFGKNISTIGKDILTGSENITKISLFANNLSLYKMFGNKEGNIPSNLEITISYDKDTYVPLNNGVFNYLITNDLYSSIMMGKCMKIV